ncbi:hypothetical protein OEZ86_009559 [Tetradesmus obliquus]|uniref:SEC7 domain-containing protein n=1 Tax=Tetradesmus obliquus TaxID=3088 RepID=A0ABY8UMT6_TETOB|nr:hypothetical protein OEZ85_001005 [Tetradesmus obliquus]WIA43025.1 hypothetical protein OEZ86_009559 [Tetradesmus obliquus]
MSQPSSNLQHQPAAELISNALHKIKKLAGGRKHAELSQQCQGLIDSIHEVLSPEFAARAAAQPKAAAQAEAVAAADEPATPAADSAAGTAEQPEQDTTSGRAASSSGGVAAAEPPDSNGSPAAAADDSAAAAAAAAAAGTAESADAATAEAEAAAAEAAAAAAALEKRAADAARLAAAVQLPQLQPQDLVQRTDSAISDAAATSVMQVLQLAVDTLRPNIVEVTLDLIHKLIAFRYLQGAAHNVQADRHDEDAAGDSKQPKSAAAEAAQQLTPQALAVQLICRCDEIPDEGVEVLVLRGLLTASTSLTFTIHGQALLLAVRTCYNIHLMSRSEVNQTTAKAALTQMLNVVFQRMEAGSVRVAVKPIAVADMLGLSNPAKSSAADASGVTSAVQGFLNNVVAAAGYGAAVETHQQLKQSLTRAILAPRQSTDLGDGGAAAAAAAAGGGDSASQQQQEPVVVVTGEVSDDEEDEERGTFHLAGSGGSGSLPTYSSSGTPKAAAGAAAAGGAGGAAASQVGGAAAAAPHGAVVLPASVALLHKDAFLVFRALCKLSIRTSDLVTVSDPTAVRGKLLALELLKVLLENSGPAFKASERFTAAIRQYLCLSLLKNSASSIPAALQLSASIFLSLLQKFRAALKAEVGVFLPMVVLKVLEPPAAAGGAGGAAAAAAAAAQTSLAVNSYSYKVVVLRCLREVCADGQLLVDLFVNYDCDIGSSNLFERLINGLVKMAQQALPVNSDAQQLQQEQWLRQEALQCLASASAALLSWYRQSTGQGLAALEGTDEDALLPHSSSQPSMAGGLHTNPNSSSNLASAAAAGGDGEPGSTNTSKPSTPLAGASAAAAGGDAAGLAGAGAAGSAAAGDALSRKRAFKEKWQEGIALFNSKPKKGIALLQNEDMLGRSPEAVAEFLAKTEGLNKTLIGDYLGEREDFALKVMHAYVDGLDFSGLEFDTAIRTFLQGFRLPGEAQKIDRLMEKFAERFVSCNPGSFKSADVAYVLAYSVIMLNTDAHNPQVKKKMSAEDFLKNNRGINDGADLAPEFMRSLYERIVCNEIQIKDDLVDAASAKAAAEAAQRGNMLMNALWSIVGGAKQAESAEPSDDAIKRTLDYLHDRAQGATYFVASDPDTVRPMLELIWAPLLGCFSLLFDEYSDPRLLAICLAGFEAATCLAAQLGVADLRDVFVVSLCNFTHLHSPATMKPKNGLAFKSLISVALQVGDHLGERWLEVLRCISRWELLQQIASGMPTDAVLFAAAGEKAGGKGRGKEQQATRLSAAADAAGAGGAKSMDTMAMSEASIKRAHIGAGKEEGVAVHPEIINSVDTAQLNKVYVSSSRLDSDAIVAFVRCLAAISLDELRDARAPRVFSLTKIVEIAHFNMGRIRLVWSRIWAVLSAYFVTVGCAPALPVAMYAVDSLRQLSMKFLERDELANYTFQNDFLRPFVVLMRQSTAVEIRELIIRCLSQMVLARVNNVKSGWKSMFMVFTTAAGDPDPTIVRLAFDTIEKIVREHFGHITETETTTFTDCVNCLIAFTNNPHSMEVALNATAFLRYCATKLAEGAIGELPEALPGGVVQAERLAPTRVVALDQQRTAAEGSSSSSYAAGSSSASGAAAGASSSSSERGQMKFVDRDEHVYFWFPLLAGLSELTFDPRPEIRRSALEVLFDVLMTHGGSFAESFWARIFERVLLPIFDHVRAEVTDTTTFTSERRRAQEDAWLYETCTHCLQHLVDLFGQFHEPMGPLLPRLLELLRGFIARSHASLASVGVAAYTRLLASCGGQLDDEAWQQVIGMLQQVMRDTLPDAVELVTPPLRAAGSTDVQAPGTPLAAAAAAAGASLAGGQPRPPYSLREGVGMRRLVKFRVQAGVQLLLVQAASEVYAQHYHHMAPDAMVLLADALQQVSQHARAANTDIGLRKRLAAQQAADRVPEERCIPDPPLLRQEAEASHAYLSVLMHVASSSGGRIPGWAGAQQAAQAMQASERLVALSYAVLERFGLGTDAGSSSQQQQQQQQQQPYSNGNAGGGLSRLSAVGKGGSSGSLVSIAAASVEYTAFAPLVVSTLKALSTLERATFQAQLGRFFPVLTALMACEHAPADVQRALSELFLTRVGPLLPALAQQQL